MFASLSARICTETDMAQVQILCQDFYVLTYRYLNETCTLVSILY